METTLTSIEIGVLSPDWDDTIDFYTQVLNQSPVYIDDSKVLFRTSEYDLYLIKLADVPETLKVAKFPPTYFFVDDASKVRPIYDDVLKRIPGAVTLQDVTSILVFPVPDAKTSASKSLVITLASVVIKPKSTCKAQVDMVLGVIHNPPY